MCSPRASAASLDPQLADDEDDSAFRREVGDEGDDADALAAALAIKRPQRGELRLRG